MKPNRKKQVIGMVIGGLLLLLSPVAGGVQYVIGLQRAHAMYERYYHDKEATIDDGELHAKIDTLLYACVEGLAGVIAGIVIGTVSFASYRRAGRTPQ